MYSGENRRDSKNQLLLVKRTEQIETSEHWERGDCPKTRPLARGREAGWKKPSEITKELVSRDIDRKR